MKNLLANKGCSRQTETLDFIPKAMRPGQSRGWEWKLPWRPTLAKLWGLSGLLCQPPFHPAPWHTPGCHLPWQAPSQLSSPSLSKHMLPSCQSEKAHIRIYTKMFIRLLTFHVYNLKKKLLVLACNNGISDLSSRSSQVPLKSSLWRSLSPTHVWTRIPSCRVVVMSCDFVTTPTLPTSFT